jgi:hypothetical protein
LQAPRSDAFVVGAQGVGRQALDAGRKPQRANGLAGPV